MESRRSTARWAGVLYFLFMLVAIYSEFLVPKFVVPGDAGATAAKIAGAELSYRLAILSGLATHVVFLFLVVVLYKLLKEVDEYRALLMVVLVSVGVAVAFVNLLLRFAPLQILANAEALSAFAPPQLDALAYGALRFRGAGALVPMAFWGLWLFPFGILVMRSGFLPRILGVLLLVAGFAYLATSVAAIVLPEQRQLVSKLMTPLYFGELPIIFWLLIKGASETAVPARPAV